MSLKKTAILFIICSISAFSNGQKPKNISIEIECGSNFVSGSLNEKWSIRQNVSTYTSGYQYGNNAISSMNIVYFGAKPVYTFGKDRFSVATGLRWSYLSSSLKRDDSSGDSFFYLRTENNANGANYFRVNKVTEDSYFVGIPFEFKCYPIINDMYKLYIKVGMDFNLKLTSEQDIKFVNESMNIYKQSILDQNTVHLSSIYTSAYSSIGIKLGDKDKINWNLELLLPSYIISSKNSSLFVPKFYSGFQFSVLIPLYKTPKNTSL